MSGNDEQKVWLITGAATGLGLAIARHALAEGHKVVATARGVNRLDRLVACDPENVLACHLDVTSDVDIENAVAKAIREFGRIDILVNNAAAGLLGAVEETSGEELRSIFATNVIGSWGLVRAVLPHMRRQGSGTVVNVTSYAALCAFTGLGAYSATKFALEGMSEALANEVSQWGIRVIIAQPGGLQTDFASHSIRFTDPMDEYKPLLGEMRNVMGKYMPPDLGDPTVAAKVLAQAVAANKPPMRLQLGADAVAMAEEAHRRREADLSAWKHAASMVTPSVNISK